MHKSNGYKLFDIILANAKALEDAKMMNKLESMKPNQIIHYHNNCELLFAHTKTYTE